MRRLLLVLLLIGLVAPHAASADPLAGPQTVVAQGTADLAAACRRDLPTTDEQCAVVPLSPAVTAARMQAYMQSDTHRRLALQHALGNDVPLRRAAWLGTHNSFNTTTRMATLSGLDSNQQLSIYDQLRSDMRSVELDAHWFPSLRAGGYGPVLCHARGQSEGHAGCTTEDLLVEGLREVAIWLEESSMQEATKQIVLIYLEDHLDTDEGYAVAAKVIRDAFGSRLYAPGGTRCTPLPMDRTRADMLRTGKQVLVISSCHSGAGWNGTIFSEAAKTENGPKGYGEQGQCDPAAPPASFDGRWLRVFEDSTALTATVDQGTEPITPGKATALQRCAVDLTGFDQLLPGDPRLAASVWSWAPRQPSAGGCVVQRSDGWHTASCSTRLPFACRTSRGWRVDTAVGPGSSRGRCKGGQVGTPRYGYEAVQLQGAMKAARVPAVWLGMTGAGTRWTARDRPV